MPVSQEVTSGALPVVNAEFSFGTLVSNFDYLDVYVDATAAATPNRIKWRLYCLFPGIAPNLVVESFPNPCNQAPYLPFASVQMIAGATYEIRGVAVDAPITVPILAGFAGTTAQNIPPTVASGSFPLSPTTQTAFATVAVYHSEFQAQVDANGQSFTASTWRLFGTITSLINPALSITAEIAVGQFADSSPFSKPYIVISTPNFNSGISNANVASSGNLQPPLRARGAGSYTLTGISLDSTGSIGPVNAALIGFDKSCCAGQGNMLNDGTQPGVNQAVQNLVQLKQ
jgi:hypothetical protein